MLPARSTDIEGDAAAELLKQDPAELKRRVSELKEENVILAKRLQETLRDSARLSATYRERQWEFLRQREPQLCSSLTPNSDLGAHLLLKMQATGAQLKAQIKELTERAERMEAETASKRLQLEMAKEEADAFEEDVRRYGVEAAKHYRRLREASAALASERRHKHLICERLRAADWALDLLLHDGPTRLLAADMMDAGPDGAVRIRRMQEQVAKLEGQLRLVELSAASVSASRRAVAERELRVLDYEEGRDKEDGLQGHGSEGSDGTSRSGDSAGERQPIRGQRRRPRSGEAHERERAARREALAAELAEQRQRARRANRSLAVLREEAEDLRAAVDKMRKTLRKIRSFDAQLQEEAENSVKLVSRAEEQHETRLRMLRRYTRARQHVSASFENALRSSQRRRTSLQSALRHSQLHLRVLHHIMQHLLPIDGSELPAQFYRGLVDASEKERDVLMDRMAMLAQRLCRAKSRAQADWQRLHAIRCRIQSLEGKLKSYVVTAGGKESYRRPLPEWSAIRERQLEKELQELQEVAHNYHEAALRVEGRYLQEMWALHHLFRLAVSRLEAQFGPSLSRSSSRLSAAASAERKLSAGERVSAEEAAASKEAELGEGPAADAGQRVARRKRRRKDRRRAESAAVLPAQDAEDLHAALPVCVCSRRCSRLPDAPCTALRKLTVVGSRPRASSLTNVK